MTIAFAPYWRGLSDDYLDHAGRAIRAHCYNDAIDSLKRALSCANRAKDLNRAGRCCAAIRRLQWLMSKIPAAPAPWQEVA